MKTFTHSGDLGDIIYSLPTIQCAGGGLIYLSQSDKTRCRPTSDTVALLAPLLEAQPCVAGVTLHNGEIPDYNLDRFRDHLGDHSLNLAGLHLKAFGFPQSALDTPWLQVSKKPAAEVVINRTDRYPNARFPWRSVVDKYRGLCVFVGLWQEHQDFCAIYGKVPFRETKDLLELAQIIAGSKLFIANQSCPAAIAEALKVPMILAVTLLPAHGHHCVFHRPDAGFYVGGALELPDL